MIKEDIWSVGSDGKNYSRFRPGVQPGYFEKITNCLEGHQNYLDLACGPGTSFLKFKDLFSGVKIATDLSDAQLKELKAVFERESLGEENNCFILAGDSITIGNQIKEKFGEDIRFDLVTISQALHYFNYKDFCEMVSTDLLKPKGIFAVSGYFHIGFDFLDDPSKKLGDQAYALFYDPIDDHFIFDRKELRSGYKEKNLSQYFQKTLIINEMVESSLSTLESFLGYVKTFSGYNLYIQKNKDKEDFIDPLELMIGKIKEHEKETGVEVKEVYSKMYNFLYVFQN